MVDVGWSLALHPEPRIEILGLVESGRDHELQSQLVNDIDWMVIRIGPFKRAKEWGIRRVQTGKTVPCLSCESRAPCMWINLL